MHPTVAFHASGLGAHLVRPGETFTMGFMGWPPVWPPLGAPGTGGMVTLHGHLVLASELAY